MNRPQLLHLSDGATHWVGVDHEGIPLWPDVLLNDSRLDVFNLYKGVVTHGGFSVVFPEADVTELPTEVQESIFKTMRNYQEDTIGARSVLRAHYEALLYNYELAHSEDVQLDYLSTESDEIKPS